MGTTRNADQSQLDWLWSMYGDKSVTSDPNEATSSDILDKDGVTRMVCRMMANLVRKIELTPNPHCNNLLDVVVTQDDGDKRVAFSIEKEDHLASVKLRKSTQADVDDGKCNEVNKFVGEFRMLSGVKHILDLSHLELEGTRTNTTETFVEDGKVVAEVRLAESVNNAISVDVTRNGILIELLIDEENDGQVSLSQTSNGLKVENKWEDGSDFRFSLCTYAQYMALCNGEVTDECELCGAENRIVQTQKGHLYFITDKNFFYLNGVRYGYTPIVSTDSINHIVTEDGVHQFHVNVSGRANNLLEAIETGLYCDFKWSGSNQATSFRVFYEKEAAYQRLSDIQKSESIFFCSDTHRLFVKGIDFSFVDLIGSQTDEGYSTVYGYINTNVKNLKERIEQVNTALGEDIATLQGKLTEVENLADSTKTELDEFKEFTANNELVLGERIGSVDERVTTVNEKVEKLKEEAVTWTDNAGVTKDILLENNSETLSGLGVNGERIKIAKISKNNEVSLGDPDFILSLKGYGEHPTYNGEHDIALLHEVDEEKERAQAKEDEIIGNADSPSSEMSLYGISKKVDDERERAQMKEDEILGNEGDTSDIMSVYGVSKYVKEKEAIAPAFFMGNFATQMEAETKSVEYAKDLSHLVLTYSVNEQHNGMIINIVKQDGNVMQRLFLNDIEYKRTLEYTVEGEVTVGQWIKIEDVDTMPMLKDRIIYFRNLLALGTDATNEQIVECLHSEAYPTVITEDDLQYAYRNGLMIRCSETNNGIMVGWNGHGYSLTAVSTYSKLNAPSVGHIVLVVAEDGTYSIPYAPFNGLAVISKESENGGYTVTLKQNESLSGESTDGVKSIAKIEEGKVNIGDDTAPISLKGSEENPKYNDKDIPVLHDFTLDGDTYRKALILKNYDTLLGTTTDGQTYNLAMLSKWNVADFGSNQVHINFNGKFERPTYNDSKGIALLDDLNELVERISLLEKATSFKVVDVLTGAHYDNAAQALEAGVTNIRVYNDFAENISVAAGKTVTMDFAGNKLSGYVKAEKLAEGETTNIVIKNAVIDNTSTIGILGQDQETIKQGSVNLRLENCTIMNFTDKGLYMTNAGKVEIVNCTFDGCSVGKDHMVDFNLCSVQNANILIENCSFVNIQNTLAPIKVCVRGGSDDYSHDVFTGLHKWDESSQAYVDQEGQPATIEQLVIKNCTFEANESTKADIIIGDVPNYDSPVEPTAGPRTSTGNFPYTVECGGNAKVWKRYEGEDSIVNL